MRYTCYYQFDCMDLNGSLEPISKTWCSQTDISSSAFVYIHVQNKFAMLVCLKKMDE